MQWTVIIPVKSLPQAKTRLASSLTDAALHETLVRAIRADTIAAAQDADGVARILVVLDTVDALDGATDAHLHEDVPQTCELMVQVEPGLNASLREAADHAAARWPGDGIAALVGDLPALQPHELGSALAAAASTPTAFVADADGVGTTLLTALPGAAFAPEFGAESAVRHARVAAPVAAAPGLRQDVDTEADLRRAVDLGVGPRTRAAAATVILCSR